MATSVTTGTQVRADAPSAPAFPPFDPGGFASQLLWLAITFGLFYYLVAKVILPRIGGILEVRSDRIAGDLDEAQRLKRESDEAIAAYEQALAEARQNAHAIALATREKLNSEIEAKRAASEAALSVKLGEAEARISGIKEQAMAEVGDIAVETTQAIVALLIGGNIGKSEVAVAVRTAIDK
jgi:F-type H+-transporting ATPase subunit b